MKNSRRNFLLNSAALMAGHSPLIAGLSALTTSALAATLESADFNFVLLRIPGGMDSTLGLHPFIGDTSSYHESDLWLNYDQSKVLKNINSTSISLGPSAEPLRPFVNSMAIIRGIYMGATELGHPKALQYMAAAREQAAAPHMLAYIGSRIADPTRFVISNTGIQRGSIESFPIIDTKPFKDLGDLSRLSSTSGLRIYQRSTLPVASFLNLLKQKDKLNKFSEILASQNKGQEIFDETVALAALSVGLSRVAQIDVHDSTQDLDTHSGHGNHSAFQRGRWERVANFLNGLEQNNLLEKTLVMVTTEFNRNPGKNLSEGKDHNYTDNAIALFGRNVIGGSAVGNHRLYTRNEGYDDSLWAGNFLNFKTGATSTHDETIMYRHSDQKILLPEQTQLIRPSDVWATVAQSLSPDLVKNLPAGSLRIPGVFKG